MLSRLKRLTYTPENKVFLLQKIPQQFCTGSMACLIIFLFMSCISWNWISGIVDCSKVMFETFCRVVWHVSCCLIWKTADLFESSILFLSYCSCCMLVCYWEVAEFLGTVWVCGQVKTGRECYVHPMWASLLFFSFQHRVTKGQKTSNKIVFQMSMSDYCVNDKKSLFKQIVYSQGCPASDKSEAIFLIYSSFISTASY